jgi:uncharacterized membrane protein YkgB
MEPVTILQKIIGTISVIFLILGIINGFSNDELNLLTGLCVIIFVFVTVVDAFVRLTMKK